MQVRRQICKFSNILLKNRFFDTIHATYSKEIMVVQHISVRVPWTDNDFIGRICDCPLKNYACRRLKSISEHSDLLCQQDNKAGITLDGITDTNKRRYLPCLNEGMAFMSDKDITTECLHNYSLYNYDSHRDFIPSQQIIPAYTLIAHPYRWLMRGNNETAENIRLQNGIPDIDADIAHLLLKDKDGNGEPVGGNWVQHPISQQKIFETFFKNVVPNKSLCFIYTKSIPYIEDADRILIGIAVVDKAIGLPKKHAKKADATSTLESFSWECMVSHKIRKNGEKFLSDDNGIFGGFLFPYAQIIKKIEKAETGEEKEKYIKVLQNIVVTVPNDFREEFSYATEHVSHDVAIYMLLKAQKALSSIIESGYVQGNLVECRKWVQEELDFIWRDRPIYPGLGSILAAAGINLPCNVIANEVNEYIQNNPKNSILDLLTAWIKSGHTPSGIEFTRSHRIIWEQAIISDYKTSESFKTIARMYISFKQADSLWEKIQKGKVNIIDNPYTIYTSTINEEEKNKISLYYVDLAFFVPKQYRDKFFTAQDKYTESADDPYRVAGFVTYVLSDARAEGHTYLPDKDIIKRLSEINVQEPCIIDENRLHYYEQKYLDSLVAAIINDEGHFYKLRYLEALDKRIRQLVDDRIMLPTMVFDGTNFNIKLPDGIQRNEKAINEQLRAAENISVSAISVLCGPAGTGKTTLLTNLCKSFDNDVLLLAPTGKARVRMQQTIGKDIQNRIKCETVAGYLTGIESTENDKKCYNYSTGQYLLPKQSDQKIEGFDVIIDESSMLTEDMFGALLVALQKAKRIIFVGDVSQLPPIGAGKPFYELMKKLQQMDFGFAELKTQVRFLHTDGTEPLDVELSKHFSLNEGMRSQAKEEVFDKLKNNEEDNRLAFIEWANPEDLRVKLAEVLKTELHMESVDDVYGFNASLGAKPYNGKQYFWCGNEYRGDKYASGIGEYADKWQIIAPLRNRFDVGTVGLNAFIHDKYRSDMLKEEIIAKESAKNRWPYKDINKIHPTPLPGSIIQGDKVINLVNTRIKPANKPSNMQYHNEMPIANGEIGIVGRTKHFDEDVYGVEFSSQPMNCFLYTEKNFFKDDNSPILELAYAITVHKSQGSDFDKVILIMGQHMPLASREMLYTALTRQKKRLIILYNGDLSSLKDLKQDSKSALLTRYSDLFEDPKINDFENINPSSRAKHIHVTDKGEHVRSKSETIVANALYRHESRGLRYHYEKPLKLDGYDKPIIPDFTIEYAGKIYYWEHLGMLSDENYRKKWMLKLELYRKNGIEPIISKDDENGGIDSKAIEQLIDYNFK